jgi:transcriptional regulator
MYAPKHFAESDPIVLRDAVRRIRAGELITVGVTGLEASFIPLLISDDAGTVTGHLAKANGQWKRAELSIPALVTWVGPDAYVSPSYYPSKHEDGKVVPTWNFISVQARGVLSFHQDYEWKRRHVESLTNFHEGALPTPWSVDDAPSDFIDGMVKAIVGIELVVTSIEGKWKLSQNRSEPDIAGVISGLESQGAGDATVVAQEMELATGQAAPPDAALESPGHAGVAHGATGGD